MLQSVGQEGFEALDTESLEICDEWQTRRWMVDQQPNLVLIGVLGQPEQTSRDLLLNTQGLINVINASVGVTDRVHVISWFASNSFFVVKRLCELHSQEKQVRMTSQLAVGNAAILEACVLVIRDVVRLSAQEAHEKSSEGEGAGEVRDQVVPQQAGDQQHRSGAGSLLEMPFPDAKGAPS